MVDIRYQDATESSALINLGIAFGWDTPDPAKRRGPNTENPLEIYCENNRTYRTCLLAPFLYEFTRSIWRLFGQRAFALEFCSERPLRQTLRPLSGQGSLHLPLSHKSYTKDFDPAPRPAAAGNNEISSEFTK